jgi:hypothetical protein
MSKRPTFKLSIVATSILLGVPAASLLWMDYQQTQAELTKLNFVRSIVGNSIVAERRVGFPWALHVAKVDLSSSQLSSADLAKVVSALADFSHLDSLKVSNHQLDRDIVSAIGKLGRLRNLELDFTNFHDDWVPHLIQLTNLQYLSMRETMVTTNSVTQLTTLSKLKMLNLAETNVSVEVVEELNRIRPDVTIIYGFEPFKFTGPGL